jgi:hypothetical protein
MQLNVPASYLEVKRLSLSTHDAERDKAPFTKEQLRSPGVSAESTQLRV